MVACGHDTGYAPFLGQFAANRRVAERITLLEGGSPFPIEIKSLGFRTTRFVSLFNEQAQPATWASSARPTMGRETAETNSKGNSNVEGPVAVVSRQVMGSRTPSGRLHKLEVQSGRLGPVLKDEKGWRIDKPLSVGAAVVDRIKKAHLCNFLYLRGECAKSCQRNHDYRPLSDEEYDALWLLARQGWCYVSRKAGQDVNNDCSDAMCIYGHGGRGE